MTKGKREERPAGQQLKRNAIIIGSLLAVTWGLEIIDQLLFQHGGVGVQGLDQYGILPRETSGLPGILLSPFLHGSFGHLAANSLPLAVMGFLILFKGPKTFFGVSLFITVLGGLLVWIFGARGYHIGASGVIFGYFGFLLAIGIFERSLAWIAVAVGVGAVYGGLIYGVMPGQPGVSWEGHLFGFFAGITAAWVWSRTAREARAIRKERKG